MGLLDAAVAHGAEEEPLYFPATPGSDDKECRPFRLLQKDVCGIAADDSCAYVRPLVCRNGAIDDCIQFDERLIDHRVEIFDVHWNIEWGGMLWERPRGDHLERHPHQRCLIGGPAKGP
jgi:hypothetical protein